MTTACAKVLKGQIYASIDWNLNLVVGFKVKAGHATIAFVACWAEEVSELEVKIEL